MKLHLALLTALVRSVIRHSSFVILPFLAAAFLASAPGSIPNFELLKSFGVPPPAANPLAALIQGADGALYGTTQLGGNSDNGTVFKLNPDGSGFTVLHNFDGSTTGANPEAALIQGADGALYGTTQYGGSSGNGTVFKLNPDGSGFTVLQNFDDSTAGANPEAALIQGADGALYGTAPFGGNSSGAGTVFKLNPDGSGFTVLQTFDYPTTGGSPHAPLIQGTDGALYGTALNGGSSGGAGTVFKLNPDGSGFTVLQTFDGSTTGGGPYAALIQGTDGALYGAAIEGGSGSYGTVFKLNPDGSGFTVLQAFDYYTTGASPEAALIQGADGALYGTAVQGPSSSNGMVFKLNPNGSGFTVLENFDGSTTGGNPRAALIQGADGALYGTAQYGSNGNGTVFKLNPDGSGFTVFQTFASSTAGTHPAAALIQGADGAFYGTTQSGGSGNKGTVFKLNPDGSGFTVLENFDSSTTGAFPSAALIQGADGALYGTADVGGSSHNGTVFKLNPDGSGFTVLQNFDGSTTGGNPRAALIQGADGALYGATQNGGSSGYGTVFKLNPDGSGFTVLQNFDDSTAGANPEAALIQGADGALYGTTQEGGDYGYGTVFKLNPDGSKFSVLLTFDYDTTGGNPYAGLIQGADGALYGTAYVGGSSGYGTVFKLNPDGSGFTVLQNFDSTTTGANPFAALIQGVDGALYGTTQGGGSSSHGTVFKLNPDGSGFTVLWNFDYDTTGGNPNAALIQGADGALYGTALSGGSGGYGTVFRVFPRVVISASAGANGSISPTGNVSVNDGANQAFTITPATGYHVADVLVDGVSAGAVTSYTFTSVTAGHTIAASFANSAPTLTLPASPVIATATSPNGAVVSFTVTANDLEDGVLTPTVAPASGSTFPAGDTTVNVSATDSAGAVVNGSFTVRVLPGFTNPAGGLTVSSRAAPLNLATLVTPAGGVFFGTGVTSAGIFTPATAGLGPQTITYTVNGVSSTITLTVINVPYDFNGDGHSDFLLFLAGTSQSAQWNLNGPAFVSSATGPNLPAGWMVVAVADFNADGHPDYVLLNTSTHQTAIWYMNGATHSSGASGPTLPAGWVIAGVADFNGDGHPDFLLFNPSTLQTKIYYLNGPALVSSVSGPTLPTGWEVVGTGDFDGDGHPDFLLFNASASQSVIWYMNGVVHLHSVSGPTLPAGWALEGTADFNGDGHPDFLLFNGLTKQMVIWFLNGVTHVGGIYVPTIPSGWTVEAAADFNGDGKPDYLLANNATGETAVWYGNGTPFAQAANGPAATAGWALVGAADFDGDGEPDYLLFDATTRQTAIWYMNGPNRLSTVYGPTVAAAGWAPVGVTDFNGDGHPDYLLFNASTGQTAIWYMNGPNVISQVYGPTVAAGWALVGAADFNGDGQPDYLLFNASTGQTAIWYLNNNIRVSTVYGPTLPADWDLVGSADFNVDGQPDYLLFNAVTGQSAIWYMNGAAHAGSVYGPTLPVGWRLIAH